MWTPGHGCSGQAALVPAGGLVWGLGPQGPRADPPGGAGGPPVLVLWHTWPGPRQLRVACVGTSSWGGGEGKGDGPQHTGGAGRREGFCPSSDKRSSRPLAALVCPTRNRPFLTRTHGRRCPPSDGPPRPPTWTRGRQADVAAVIGREGIGALGARRAGFAASVGHSAHPREAHEAPV